MARPKGSPKLGGRKKGTPNKVSASIKECILEVHKQLGGVDAMLDWAKDNPEAYYTKLLPRIIPTTHAGSKDEPPIQHELSVILGNMR